MNYDSLSVGEEVVSRTIDDLQGDEIKLGVAVLRDQNPIHFDERLGREDDRDGLINLGPMNMAYMMQGALEVAETPQHIDRFKVRFEDNVLEGETVTVRGTVTDKRRDGDTGVVDLDLTLEKEGGAPAVTGEATVQFPGD
jgi:acyl dehydratase